jgi:hypothetical protein
MMTTQFLRILPSDIARAMGVSESTAWTIAKYAEREYFPERQVRVGRKLRPLDVPKPVLKKRLRRLHKWLQQIRVSHTHAYGGVTGQSCFHARGQAPWQAVHLDT